VGERWTLLIVRDMLLGPRRYSQLLESLQGITTNLLAKRLKDMQRLGLIEKCGGGSAARYRLTEEGAALEPAVMELARWGGRFMGTLAPEDRHNLGWALLSCKRRYPGGEEGLRVDLATQDRNFELAFEAQRLLVQEVAAGQVLSPQLSLRGPEADYFALLFQGSLAPSLEVEEKVPGSLARLSRALQLNL
jgi:DNA-binding HxlR family transcriptional regulator